MGGMCAVVRRSSWNSSLTNRQAHSGESAPLLQQQPTGFEEGLFPSQLAEADEDHRRKPADDNEITGNPQLTKTDSLGSDSKQPKGLDSDFGDTFPDEDLVMAFHSKHGSPKSRRAPACRITHCLCMALALLATGLWLATSTFSLMWDEQVEDFVRVSGTGFEYQCRPYHVVGFNTHDLVQVMMVNPTQHSTEGGRSGRQMITEAFSQARAAGLNTVRTWVHTNDRDFPFQVARGRYNEGGLAALDFVVELARRNGMKVILSLIDNWKYYNGVDQFLDWSSTAPARNQSRPEDKFGDPTPQAFEGAVKNYEVARHALFWTDPGTKAMYKKHARTIITRTNSYNGRIFRDDPTIMAWDLVNEPRCEVWRVPDCARYFQEWLEEMSTYIKSLDNKHLVTIGSEGFFGSDDLANRTALNPAHWGATQGQSFLANNAIQNIDFATIHVWPNNWERTDDQFQVDWINGHIKAVEEALQKPLLLEEFGKKLVTDEERSPAGIRRLRDPLYELTFSLVEKAIDDGRPLGGSLFWRWAMPMFSGMGPGEYGISPKDSTFALIKKHAGFIARKNAERPPHRKCHMQCWVPQRVGIVRTCTRQPDLCSAFWRMDGLSLPAESAGRDDGVAWERRFLRDEDVLQAEASQRSLEAYGHELAGGRNVSRHARPEARFFASKTSCCRPGSGAWESGCSLLAALF